MKIETISGPTQKVLRVFLQRCELFAGLAETFLNGLIDLVGGMQVYDEGEQVIGYGEPASRPCLKSISCD